MVSGVQLSEDVCDSTICGALAAVISVQRDLGSRAGRPRNSLIATASLRNHGFFLGGDEGRRFAVDVSVRLVHVLHTFNGLPSSDVRFIIGS